MALTPGCFTDEDIAQLFSLTAGNNTLTGTLSLNAGNGAVAKLGVNQELLTLSTIAATTDTVANLLPANSLILGVSAYVVTTIATATNWQLGDATTAGRFSAVSTGLTAGSLVPTTAIPPVQVGTGVASATTGMWQLAAAKVRVTTTGSQTTGGVVRISVLYLTLPIATS